MPYNAENWYWIVNGDETQVFSSAVGDYVPADDPTYLAWGDPVVDRIVTNIANEQELVEVLARSGIRSEVLPPPVTPVPISISDRQFAHALKLAGLITHAEAMAFVQTGTIPAALEATVAGIENQEQREAAELMIAGATVFERNHPMTVMLGQAMGWTEEELDDLWRAAAEY